VMPVRVRAPYGREAAEEAFMVQQSPTPASAPGPETSASTSRLSAGLVATLVGIGLIVVLMVQNTQDVTLHLLFWDVTWPLWLYTPVVAVLGALVWIGLGVLRRHRRRVARRADRRD
jgi:uncharacterized integral membrane protein